MGKTGYNPTRIAERENPLLCSEMLKAAYAR